MHGLHRAIPRQPRHADVYKRQDMGYSDLSFALVLQLYLLPDGEKGQRPGPEGTRN